MQVNRRWPLIKALVFGHVFAILCVSGSAKAELPLYYEGEVQRVEPARVAVCLVLVTGRQQDVSQVFLRAGLLISALLRRGDSICVISATQSPTRILPYTIISETEQIVRSLKRTNYQSGPYIFAALSLAQAELSKDVGGRSIAKEIIVLSSAESALSGAELSIELACRLRYEQIRISGIGYGSAHDEVVLSALALRSTGVYRFAPNEQQLQVLLEHFIPSVRVFRRYAEQEFKGVNVSYRQSDHEAALLLLAEEAQRCRSAPEIISDPGVHAVGGPRDIQKARWQSFIAAALHAAQLQEYRRIARMIEERLSANALPDVPEARKAAERRVLHFYRRLLLEERFGLLRKYLLAARFGQREKLGAEDAI